METRKQILTELQEISPFLGRAGFTGIPYAVPRGFFDEFPEILMTRIHFEGSGAAEPAKEIEEISTLLAGLQKKNPYQVPEGFFDQLNVRIPVFEKPLSTRAAIPPAHTKTNTPVKSISFPVRMIRYAVAACIVGLIGITVYNMTQTSSSDPIKGLTTVSDQDMANYLYTDNFQWAPETSTNAETAGMDFNDNDIRDLLSSVPDVELEQYLPELPTRQRTVN